MVHMITTLRPTGNGFYSQLTVFGDTPGWKCVDDITTDDDSTYLYNTTFDKSSVKWFEPFTDTDCTIASVTLYVRGKAVSRPSNIGEVQIVVYQSIPGGGFFSNYLGVPTSVLFNITDYSTLSAKSYNNPLDGLPWTTSGINAMQFGVTNLGYPTGQTRITQMYLEVNCIIKMHTTKKIKIQSGYKVIL